MSFLRGETHLADNGEIRTALCYYPLIAEARLQRRENCVKLVIKLKLEFSF